MKPRAPGLSFGLGLSLGLHALTGLGALGWPTRAEPLLRPAPVTPGYFRITVVSRAANPSVISTALPPLIPSGVEGRQPVPTTKSRKANAHQVLTASINDSPDFGLLEGVSTAEVQELGAEAGHPSRPQEQGFAANEGFEPQPGAGDEISAGLLATAARRRAALEVFADRLAHAAAQCYPPNARRARQTGQLTVHFCLDSSGALASLGQVESSGSALFDHAATHCVVPGALPYTPLAGDCFSLPVAFRSR